MSWNDLYYSAGNWNYSEDQFKKNWEQCKKERKNRIEHQGKSIGELIDACVEDALKNGDHAAFATLYSDMICPYSVSDPQFAGREYLFREMYQSLMEDYKNRTKDNPTQPKGKRNLQIIDTLLWRSPDYEYSREDVEEDQYGKSILDKWNQGENIPDKDAIVQIGLSVGTDVKKVNEMLRIAGKDMLYPLDICDVISMYYLELYHDDFTIDPFNKLSTVKGKINEYLGKTDRDHIKYEADKRDIYKYFIDAESFEDGCSPDFIDGIEKEITRIKQSLDAGIDKTKHSDASYLTRKFEDYYSGGITLEEYVNKAMLDDESIFVLNRYGYLRTLSDFTRKSFSSYVFKMQGFDFADFEHLMDKTKDLLSRIKSKISFDNEDTDGSRDLNKRIIQWSKVSERSKRLINGENSIKENDKLRGDKDKTLINAVYGQKVIKKETGSPMYQEISMQKKHLIRLAIIAGMEDRAPRFLINSGFWDIDLTAVKSIDERIDLTDLLLIYALKYKEKVISSCCEGAQDRKMLREGFPFLSLMQYICRDTQVAVAMQLEDHGEDRRFIKKAYDALPISLKDDPEKNGDWFWRCVELGLEKDDYT